MDSFSNSLLHVRLLLACVVGGCTDTAVLFPEGPPAVLPWGTYAATLNVPPCPEAPVLLVDTLDTAIDGPRDASMLPAIDDRAQAGASLSLPEALWIAANRPGPDTIFFDERVFPVEAPGRIEQDSPFGLFPSDAVAEVCIDGRARGVEIVSSTPSLVSVWGVGMSSLQVGLTFRGSVQSVFGGTVAGCRYTSRAEFFTVFLVEGAFGPGNVTYTGGIRLLQGRLMGNALGFDPTTGEDFPGVLPKVEVEALNAIIADNLFSIGSFGIAPLLGGPAGTGELVIRGNTFRRSAHEAVSAGATITGIAAASQLTIGPGNTFQNLTAAIEIRPPRTALNSSYVQLTENKFENCENTMVYDASVSPVPVPVITEVTAAHVRGTCDGEGTIEVFSDPGGQATQFHGRAACIGSSWQLDWSAALSVPSPPTRVTATVTTPDDAAAGRPGAQKTSDLSLPVPWDG